MSRYTRPIRSSIPIRGVQPLENLDITSTHCLVIVTGDPVLRTWVTEPQVFRGQLGNNIICVSNPVQRALVGDVLS